tara:strand:- start:1199 stop:2308 length:1110 start_codon:yes stop_codon:yes gene_type:complete
MSEARVNNLSNESNTGGPTLSGITTFSGTNYFVPPVGTTAQRPQDPQKGALRFNTDSKHLEYYRGEIIGWSDIEASSEELDGGIRGFILGGATPSQTDRIDSHNLSSPGTWVDFGSLFSGRYGMASTSSRVRAVSFGGYGSNNDTVDYLTMASTGDSIDALNLSVDHKYPAAWSNGTRACVAGSYYPAQINNIDYVNISTLNYAVDFGDLTVKRGIMKAANSTTRGIIGGGYSDSNAPTLTIDYVTTATTGHASDFGDMISYTGQSGGATCNATRALWGGSYNVAIGYITMATLGNALDFGDAVNAWGHRPGMSSSTRGMWGGGKGPAGNNKTEVDYVEIATTGNARDFGDLSQARSAGGGTSNGHGGL